MLALVSAQLNAQTISLVVKAGLPTVLDESSGLAVSDRNHIWSHNDSGGNPELYEFDSAGSLLRTLHIQNAFNRDWEELTRDTAGNIYIGDFGNNNNARTNLVIYKIANPDTVVATSVIPQNISFTYPDQHAFPPADSLLDFDMEAMFWYRGSIYLFSKNRTSPYDGYTKMYTLPDSAGTYTATLVDSFYTGAGPLYLSWVTAADISPDGKHVALLVGNGFFVFSDFTGDNFFGGTNQKFTFANITQREAIAFISNDELYLSEEGTTGKLYYTTLRELLPTGIEPQKKSEIHIYPNPAHNGIIQLEIPGELVGGEVSFSNILGQVVFKTTITNRQVILNTYLAPGLYFARISSGSTHLIQRLIVD